VPDDDPGFCLLDRPWITVTTTEGRTQDVSLIDLFRRADRIVTIGGEVPTQAFALLRLALAVLHRAFVDVTPETNDDVPATVVELRDGWDAEVEHVVDYLERHRDRFDLFDAVAPFAQTPGMRTAKGEVSPLSKLVVDVPNGTPYLTMRSARNLERIGAAEAARWLVHCHAYDPSGIKTGVVGHPRAKGGKVYPEGAAWTGQLGGQHLVGSTLRDTLLLNLWATDLSAYDVDADLPAWERPAQTLTPDPALGARPAGPVDLYTWQPRRVLLQRAPEGDDVTGVLLTYGDRFIVQERQRVVVLEPMTPWRYSKPQSAKYGAPTYMVQSYQPGTVLWRGIENLARPESQRSAEQPLRAGVVRHAAELRGSALLADGLVRLHAVGVVYGSQDSVVDQMVDDGLDLPAALLDPGQAELRAVAVDAVASALAGVDALRGLAANLALAAGGSGDALDGPRARARESALAALDRPYRTWLRVDLPRHVDDPGLATAEWHSVARRVVARMGEEIVAQAPSTAWRGWAADGPRVDVGKADAWFRAALSKAFPKADRVRPAARRQEEQT